MEFKKYNSLTNSYKGAFLSKIQNHGLSGGCWYVTEKVHGANFSIIVTNDGLQFASRNGILEGADAENFYEVGEDFLNQLGKSGCEIFTFLRDACGIDVEQIQVFGELFGGGYDHPDVERCDVPMIQKGVKYCPDHQFRAFDIVIKETGKDEYYVTRPALETYCNVSGLKFLPIMYTGTMEDCLTNVNVEFITTIPEQLGLPAIDDNLAEGYVCRPLEPVFMGETFVALKVKHPRFADKQREPKVPRVVGDAELVARDVIGTYIHQTRLDSALSKVGQCTYKNIGAIMKEMISDVLKDFAEDDGALLEPLSKTERKELNKFVGGQCRQLILANIEDD